VRLVALVERKLREWPIERNERLIHLLIERETEFWDHVQRRNPPDVDFTKAGCLRAVQSLFPDVGRSVVRLDDQTSALWEAYEAAGRQIGELHERREQWKALSCSPLVSTRPAYWPAASGWSAANWCSGPYEVAASEYVDVRTVKYDGSPLCGTGASD
jgi:hypothetical protein